MRLLTPIASNYASPRVAGLQAPTNTAPQMADASTKSLQRQGQLDIFQLVNNFDPLKTEFSVAEVEHIILFALNYEINKTKRNTLDNLGWLAHEIWNRGSSFSRYSRLKKTINEFANSIEGKNPDQQVAVKTPRWFQTLDFDFAKDKAKSNFDLQLIQKNRNDLKKQEAERQARLTDAFSD
jgi:hypothetical protein